MAEQNNELNIQRQNEQNGHSETGKFTQCVAESAISLSEWSTDRDAHKESSLGFSTTVRDPPDTKEKLRIVLGFYHIKNIFHSSDERPRTWKTALVRFGPLSGILCMGLAFASIIASLGILVGSDKQSVAHWVTPPSTYLAIFTAVANLSVRYAALQGVVIAWWTMALKGSNLSKLHWEWKSGTSIRGALTAGRRMGLLGLGCVFSTVVVIDGPLLQRASTVLPAAISQTPISLEAKIVPVIPKGFTGFWFTEKETGMIGYWSGSFNETIPTPTGNATNTLWPEGDETMFSAVTPAWYASQPLGGVIRGCPGSCKAKLIAPAMVSTSCMSLEYPLSYTEDFDIQKVSTGAIAAPLNADSLIITTNLLLQEHETVNLITAYATASGCDGPDSCEMRATKGCRGTVNLTTCTLKSGVGEYEVEIQNNEILMDRLKDPKVIATANNTVVNHTIADHGYGHGSTLAGISAVINLAFGGYMSYYDTTELGLGFLFIGSPAVQTYQKPASGECPSFQDPRPGILNSINKLMVYTGAFATKTGGDWPESSLLTQLPVNPTITGYSIETQSLFHTDYWFFLAAALVELVCVVLITPLYWGWWKLGRAVSFSPLEMAKAFESPMLADCNSNSTANDLAQAVEGSSVKYGTSMTDREDAKVKLAFGDSLSVTPPKDNMRFDV